jgi:DNA-binding PadR family transcriptional regulator
MSDMDISAPLKPAVLHILLSLADEERHGYAMMQAVNEQSGGAVPLRTGSFYRHLARLVDDGWVAETAAPSDADPRRGVYYRLTPRGRAALEVERHRLLDLIAAFPRRTRKSQA